MNRPYAFKQLILARLREFYREPHAVFWVYGFPLILAVVLGLAFSRSKPVPPTVDVFGTEAAATLKAAEFDVHPGVVAADDSDSRKRLSQNKTSLIVKDHGDGKFEYVFDQTRADNVQARYQADAVLSRAHDKSLPKEIETKIETPGSRYIDFLWPGLVGINLMGGGLFGVGFVLVDMRVRKLFKRLMATPMHRGDFLVSMLVSRLLLLVPEMVSLLVVARMLFGVPVNGSWGTLILVVVLGATAFAGIGLLLASRTEKTETISGLINLLVLPMYLFSGVFFSSKKFPDVMQPFIQALPLTQLNDALRAVMIEGTGLADIGVNLLVLSLWAGVSFALALKWFKWT